MKNRRHAQPLYRSEETRNIAELAGMAGFLVGCMAGAAVVLFFVGMGV